MILMVSGRTDIVAFYSKWFMNRYHEGYVDVRNPFNPKLVSRISFDNVDLIMFCTKNPIPIVKHLKEINKPIVFHITLTPYNSDIEPNVPDKKKIINAIKEISNIIGIDNVYVRYDPIFLNDKYDINYHKKAFNKMCILLKGYVKNIIISFVDNYKNVRKNKNYLKIKEFTCEDYKEIGISFSKSAKDNNMTVATCCEEFNLCEYGFVKNECLSILKAYNLTGKIYNYGKIRNNKNCKCVETVDIGAYNSCKHLCMYCYANYDDKQIDSNVKKHNPNSSLLIGELEYGDIIKERYK